MDGLDTFAVNDNKLVVADLTPNQSARLVIYLCAVVDALSEANICMGKQIVATNALPPSVAAVLTGWQGAVNEIMEAAAQQVQTIRATPHGTN